jgi:hypothetical protein
MERLILKEGCKARTYAGLRSHRQCETVDAGFARDSAKKKQSRPWQFTHASLADGDEQTHKGTFPKIIMSDLVLGSDLLSGHWQRLRRFAAHRQRVACATKAVDDEPPISASMAHIKVNYHINIVRVRSCDGDGAAVVCAAV